MIIIPSNMEPDMDHAPPYQAFIKMELIVKEMQHKEKGVPVRSLKNFLTTIPCAFTGYDLVEWLIERLALTDTAEAIQLASLCCQHGYFFPVNDTRSPVARDDSTLYRFQTPYFWPSQNWEPDNVDYAIYLAKRAMRNKQKHGLEDYEQEALLKLQKMLCDKWDFIYMQAEEHARLAKDRKKIDKVVLDSQERAFWRVHRPAPGQAKWLDRGVKKNFRPSQMAQRRRRTTEGCKKEIQFIKYCLKQPKMKVSKVAESLFTRYEQYEEHDPFFISPQPSNPWISDDITMWAVCGEGLTERQVKRWSFDLPELLRDPRGRQEFETFLEKEYSSENIHFWAAAQGLKKIPLSQVETCVDTINKEYLASGAPCEINIDSKTMEITLQSLKNPSRFTFEAAESHIFLLMKKDSYSRFLRSEQYKSILAAAVNPCPKKKFFAFGSKKKSPAPSPSPKPKRRGSAGGAVQNERLVTNSLSHHSYSTGNLQDLDIQNDKSTKSSTSGSSADLKRRSSGSRFSPGSLRKKLDDLVHRAVSNSSMSTLTVPQPHGDAVENSLSDDDDSSQQGALNIQVPKASAHNVVAPWED